MNAVRVREVLAADGTVELFIAGTPRNDVVQVDDNGSAEAGNITVHLGNGRTYTSSRAVSYVMFDARRGNDQFTYNLKGDLMAGRTVIASLGAGQDRFLANIDHPVRTTNTLDLEGYGGPGQDNLSIVQTGPTLAGTVVPYLQGDGGNDTLTYTYTGDIAAGAVVAPGLSGSAGNDTLRLNYTGRVLGQLFHNYTLDGGAGNDHLVARAQLLASSSGQVGHSSDVKSLVTGGTGNDTVAFDLVVETLASKDANGKDTTIRPTIFAMAMGGADRDNVTRSSNVLGDNSNENDALSS